MVSVCLFVRVCRFLVYRFFVFWFCLSGDVCLLFCLSVCECLPGFQSAVVCLSVVGLSFSLSGRVCLYVDVHPNVSVFLSAFLWCLPVCGVCLPVGFYLSAYVCLSVGVCLSVVSVCLSVSACLWCLSVFLLVSVCLSAVATSVRMVR